MGSMRRIDAQAAPRAPRGALAALVVALAASACGQPAGGDAAPPSILLISVDTLRADHLGLYGYERDTSPYLDRLAAESLVFDRAYTTAAWTLVAHMSMLTGLEGHEHGVMGPERALSPAVPTVAERLRAAGYRTLGFYSARCRWIEPRYGFDRGFDVYKGYRTPEEARAAAGEALAASGPDRPLFLFLHIFDVHTPEFTLDLRGFYDPPAPYDTAFQEDARERLAHVDCRSVWDGKGEQLKKRELAAMTALYDGGVRYADAQLETWIEGWRESGLLDRSLLIVTADHGEALGQRGWLKGHGGMYEEGLRIPLLARFPDAFRAGEREAGLVSVVDFAPTFLELAGLPVEPWRAGRSLRLEPPPDRVVRAINALVGESWKLHQAGNIRNTYHLGRDPRELEPLPDDAKETRKAIHELKGLYEAAVAARPPPPGKAVAIEELDTAAQEALRALGYAGEVDED